jgi:hypothetical protein
MSYIFTFSFNLISKIKKKNKKKKQKKSKNKPICFFFPDNVVFFTCLNYFFFKIRHLNL